jgi:hypothetical protein
MDVVTSDESFATMETGVLESTGDKNAARVGERQNDVGHLLVHLGRAEQINQLYLDGQYDPQKAYEAIMAIGEHSSEHLKKLEMLESRQKEFQALYKRWRALSNDLQRLENELEAQNENGSPQQQLSEDGQIKMAKVQMDSQVKQQKMLMDEQRKNEKFQTEQQRRLRKQQFDETLADSRNASQILRLNR